MKKYDYPIETRIPNEKTIEAFKEIEEGKGKSFDTIDELLKDLESSTS